MILLQDLKVLLFICIYWDREYDVVVDAGVATLTNTPELHSGDFHINCSVSRTCQYSNGLSASRCWRINDYPWVYPCDPRRFGLSLFAYGMCRQFFSSKFIFNLIHEYLQQVRVTWNWF